MKTKLTLIKSATLLVLLSTLNPQLSTWAQGTAFTYQGRLNDGATPANGSYDLTFALFKVVSGAGQVGATLTSAATVVSNGLFTVALDFGANFPGADRWLEIGVRTNAGGAFTTLSPRQELTPTPYAIMANSASNLLGTLPAGQLSGTVPVAQLPGTVLTNHESGVTLSNLTLNGALYLPSAAASPDIFYSGSALLFYADNNQNFFSGLGAGNSALSSGVLSGSGNTGNGSDALYHNTSGSDNTANGYAALVSNTSGSYNTANGFYALFSNATGSNNTANGYGALFGNTSGFGNTANGAQALSSNRSGSENAANGALALYSNTDGSANTANGFGALFSNASGSNNTANGAGALGVNTNGFGNTASGAQALANSTSGDHNIALGYQAGYNIGTGSSNIDIGNPGLYTDTNIIRIGNGQSQTFIAGVINGDGGGLSNLNVSAAQLTSVGNNNGGTGNFFLGPSGNPTMSGSENTADGYQALLNNTSGYANTADGAYALYSNTSGSHNTAYGLAALNNNSTGGGNTANGAFALNLNTSGSNNIALGFQAGLNNTTGSSNIDIGNPGLGTDANIIRIGSGQSQTFIAGVINGDGGGLTSLNAARLTSIGNTNASATGNFFLGPSGNSTTSGSDNTANGIDALASNTSGSFNTADGDRALYHNTNGFYNTAFGLDALFQNTSGFYNTANGAGALYGNTSGSQNTASGESALLSNTTGIGNIALGFEAGMNLTTGSFNIDIGNQGLSTDNNIIRIGTPGTQTSTYLVGNVLLSGNTWLNDHNIYFRPGGDANHGLGFFGSGSINGLFAGTNVNGPVLWGNGGGALGTFNGAQAISLYWTATSVTVNGTFNNNSDRNAKDHFASISPATILDKLAHLPISEWSYKVDGATRHIGPMAQDFYAEFNVGTDDRHIAPIDEGGVALAAIQGLNQKLIAKDAEIETLKEKAAKVDSLEKRLAELERLVHWLAEKK